MPEPPRLEFRAVMWLCRMLAILLAATLVALPLLLSLGPPNASRLYGRNEMARFAPTWGHGVIQLAGETLLSILGVYVARRWLRIRL